MRAVHGLATWNGLRSDMQINLGWSDIKAFVVARNLCIQYVIANNTYYLFASDGPMEVTAQIPMDGSDSTDQTDFETNYMPTANKPLLPSLTTVTTQFEFNNKDLKIACTSAELPNDGATTSAIASIKCPGTFGTGLGRYIAGGYGITEDYNKDDRALLYVNDDDRCVAWALALASNPSATAPLSDATVIALGTLPAPFNQAFPLYPVIKTYYDDQAPSDNQGWYFWAEAQGDGLPPIGETELEPIAGYAFLPSGFYLKIKYIRPAGVFTGGIRVNLDWGIPAAT